jgi:hypothetical protein
MSQEFGGRTQEIFDAVPEHLLGGAAKTEDAKLPAAGITRNRGQMEGVATTLSECAERERHFWIKATLDVAEPNVMLPAGIGRTFQVIVQNGTAKLPSRCHPYCMLRKKADKKPGNETRASVRKEMAKARMARSARIAELNLDTARIPEQPSATMPGTVCKIIPPPHPSQPEKAQIAVDGADQRYRYLRIENTLTDENGDDVKLKRGARVEVTVTAEPKTSAATNEDSKPTRRETAGPGFRRHDS